MILMSLYLKSVHSQLGNQITFSAYPLSKSKSLLYLLLSIIISTTFAIGYINDSAKNSYTLPPQAKTFLSDQLKIQLEATKKQQDPENKAPAISPADEQKQIQTAIDEMEKKLEPMKKSIPPILGVTMFFMLQTAYFILGYISLIVLYLLFWLLKITHFAGVSKETREVEHLTLNPASAVIKGKIKK